MQCQSRTKRSWVQPTQPLLPPTLPCSSAHGEGVPESHRVIQGQQAAQLHEHVLRSDTLFPLSLKNRDLKQKKGSTQLHIRPLIFHLLPFNQTVTQT